MQVITPCFGILRGGILSFVRRYLLPIGLGLLLFIVAFVYMLPGTNQSVNIYDEGIVVYSAVRVMEGHVPYRDFWSIYSPGQFYALAALFSAFGASIQTERLWDAALRALVPLFAYLIAARFTTRVKALVAWAAATAWMGFYAYSYFYQWTFFGYPAYPAIAFSLATLWLMTVYFTDPRRRWLVGSGIMLGITTLFRHDFGIYCGIGVFLALVLFTLLRPREGSALTPRMTWRDQLRAFWRVLWPFALSAAVVVLPVAIYFVTQVKLSELVYDLFTFPASIFPRFRALPYPPNGPYGPKEFPQILPFYLPFLVFLMAGVVAFITARKRTVESVAHALCIVMLIVFGLFAFNQARVRADVIHTPAFFIPSIILLVILLRGIPQPTRGQAEAAPVLVSVATLLLVLVFAEPVVDRVNLLLDAQRMAPALSTAVPRATTAIVNPNLSQAVQFIRANTRPDERIFVGNTFHDKVFVNEPMFYFLAERDSATRYHELHPGVATTAPVQQEIADDIEKYQVQYLVISSQFEGANEPNESSVSSGVKILDTYISDHYLPMASFGPYRMYRRVR